MNDDRYIELKISESDISLGDYPACAETSKEINEGEITLITLEVDEDYPIQKFSVSISTPIIYFGEDCKEYDFRGPPQAGTCVSAVLNLEEMIVLRDALSRMINGVECSR